jgi:hypothetical protein
MADQVDITGEALKLLKQIEAHTKAASMMSPDAPQQKKGAVGGGKKDTDAIRATSRALGDVGDEADDLADSLSDIDKAFKKVTKALGNFVTGLKQPKVLDTSKQKLPKAAVPDFSAFKSASDTLTFNIAGVAPDFGKFSEGLLDAAKSSYFFGQKLGTLKIPSAADYKRPGAKPAPAAPVPVPATAPIAAVDANRNLAKSTGILGGVFDKLMPKTAGFGYTLEQLIKLIKGPVIEVFNDAYRLQARGISAQQNLVDFYIAAAKAGMSLQEYTHLLDENRVVVARSGSFEAFNKKLESSTDALASLGVFGVAARQMSATMMSSSTTLGVPQAQLGGVMEQQIKMFKELRDTTGLTADGFSDLLKEVSANEHVQSELLGMAPKDRAARLLQLTQTRALGETMGLTKESSRALGDALLAQRGAMSEDRFKGMGMVRQAGGILGMGSSDTEELARIAQKKTKTPEEEKRMVALAGQMEASLQAMENSNNIGSQNIAEQLRANMPSYMQNILTQSGKAKATMDSGDPTKLFNAQLDKSAAELGKFAALIEGITKNPLWHGLEALGKVMLGVVSTLAPIKILKAGFGKAAPEVGAAAKAGAAVSAELAPVGEAATTLGGRLLSALTSPLQMLRDIATFKVAEGSFTSYTKALPKMFAEAGTFIKDGISGLSSGILKSTRNFAGNLILYTAEAGQSFMEGARGIGALFRSGSSGMMTSAAEAGQSFMKGTQGFATFMKSGGASMLTSVIQVGKDAGSMWTGLKGVVGGLAGGFMRAFSPELGFIFGAVEEAFTGEMATALDLGDGIFGRILGAVVAGFNGILTGVTRLLDDGINWVLEGLGFSTKVNFTKVIDFITSLVVVGFKQLMYTAVAALKETLSFIFGDSIPFVRSLNSTIIKLGDSIEEQQKTTAEMLDTTGSTLRKEGEKQQKALQASAKKTTEAVDKTAAALSGGVVMGLDALQQSAQATVDAAQAAQTKVAATPAATAQPAVATPGQTDRPGINQPDVNKAKVADTAQDAGTKTNTTDGMAAAVKLLEQQLETAKLILAALTSQQTPAQPVQLAPRTSFADNAELMKSLNGMPFP